jgi:glycine/D-amino acid oxidase-like deaminating enzyme
MKTRYGVSPWIQQVPPARRPAYPRFRGEHTTDVIVIGGGLVGCAVAQMLAAGGHRLILLEADRIGGGATGRSAGVLLPEPGPSFRELAGTRGRRVARQVFEAWRLATLDGAAQLRRLGVPCGLTAVDLLHVATGEQTKALARERDARVEAGLDAPWIIPKTTAAAARLADSSALRAKGAFTLDPYRACLGLAGHAVRRGAALFERSPVRKVRFSSKAVEVTVDGGRAAGKAVVVATGFATAEFKPLQRHFKRQDTYLTLTQPLPAAMRRALAQPNLALRDSHTPPRRFRWVSNGRLLVWGADQPVPPARLREAALVQRTGQLMYELLTLYPAISGLQPEFGWDAPYGETADGVMYIGAHRNYPRHLFALGGPPDSLTGAFLAARVLLRALERRPEKGDEVFGWVR